MNAGPRTATRYATADSVAQRLGEYPSVTLRERE